jgi:hypothetical protein
VQHSLITINCTFTIGIAGLERLGIAKWGWPAIYITTHTSLTCIQCVYIHTWIPLASSLLLFLSSVKETVANSINQITQQGENKEQRKRREEKRRERTKT